LAILPDAGISATVPAEDTAMTNDPNALQNEQTEKLMAAGLERELRQRTEKIAELLQGLTDDQRKRIIGDAMDMVQ
jgi:hypothetical protein